MKYLFVFVLISFLSQTMHAQTISGTITDADKKLLPKASVSLLKANDSTLVKLNAADAKGIFHFDAIAKGHYLLMVSNVGFENTYSSFFEIKDTIGVVQNISMEKINTQLSGVVVTAKKPPIEIKAGKTVVNVDAAPTNAGLNVLEILEKSPGVSLDADDNINLKGKGGVLILIDDKPTYLTGTQLTSFLKSIQASGLNQIEIMTNPPAKYDAEGGAGIINIKTKKGTLKGINGNVDLSYIQGYYPKYKGAANINYRNNKLNLFGSYNAGQWEGINTLYLNRRFYKDGMVDGSSDQKTVNRSLGNWYNGRIGLDYNFTEKDVIGVVVNGNINSEKDRKNSLSNLRDQVGNINTAFISDVYNTNKSTNISTNLNYKHTFDSLGKVFSVDLDQVHYESEGSNFLTTKVYNRDNSQRGNSILLDGKFPSIIKIYSGKADYVHPFNKNTKLETGIKSSFVNTDNNVMYQRDTSTGWFADNERSNHFIYKENINAAYAIFSTTVKKWELTAGLRMENTNAEGLTVKTDSSFKRSYTNLFPNAGLVYHVNDKNQLSASYSRRIQRPDYEDLNPFIFFLDSLTYGQGNPYLQPQFSNNVELSHTFNNFLTTTINYTKTDNIITELLKQDNEKKTAFQTKENFSKMRQWGFTATANKQIVKWLNVNIYANVFDNRYRGVYINNNINTPIEVNVNGFMGNLTNSFTFAKTWNAELSGWYASRLSEGLLIGRQMGEANVAISKKILKNNGTIKVGIEDIFRTNNFSGITRYADVDIDVLNDRKIDNRRLSISFVYKFGKSSIATDRRRTGGADDEQNRIGGN